MAIYNPLDDARLETDQSKKYIVSWTIRAEWNNGEMEDIADVPDDAAAIIDEWLAEIEQEQQTLPYQHCGE
jgi:hypothetical protein